MKSTKYRTPLQNVFGRSLFLIFIFSLAACLQKTYSQTATTSMQDSVKVQVSPIITTYLSLKDALVAGNSTAAISNSNELIKAINDSLKNGTNQETWNSLLNDATSISQASNIKIQREKFVSLSQSMMELAKTLKLSNAPLYVQYCPMKKASWLSDSKNIRNPYYGNMMLTCGSVKETIQ